MLPAARPTGVVGIVMLDTRFPRPPGDVGHPDSFGIPTLRGVVHGAWPDNIVASAAGLRAARVVPAFVAVARQLERDGVLAITTSCGFLVLLQKELQAAVKVPVVTSSLLQLPGLLAQEPQVGVLTISARHLGREHLRAAGVPRARLGDVVVQGMDPQGEFAGAILGNHEAMDLARAGAEVVAAAVALKVRAPTLRTIVLECTNMPPYAQAIRETTGLQVRSLLDAPQLHFSRKP
ncbi:MAG: aspartate/glutamate racemase family protein [Ramlibacter sp.]